MKTIEIKLYKFNELSEEAQQTAIEKLSDINVSHDWWDFTYEDAKNIGLKITGFDLDRNRHANGKFIDGAIDCANKIISEHGKDCETYKTAQSFLSAYDNISTGEESDIEDAENDFLNSLSEDYSIILQNECEYLQSEEAIIETIHANNYDFTEDGKIY